MKGKENRSSLLGPERLLFSALVLLFLICGSEGGWTDPSPQCPSLGLVRGALRPPQTKVSLETATHKCHSLCTTQLWGTSPCPHSGGQRQGRGAEGYPSPPICNVDIVLRDIER